MKNFADLPNEGRAHVIVFGAGPSAPRYYEWVKAQDALVVAPSTMLKPLQDAGIFPEYTCCIDPSAVMKLHFRGTVKDKSLVYLPSIVESIYREWEGRHYRVWDLPGPSVLHLCVDTALKIGASAITLVGADFCFGTEAKSHAAGVTTAYPIGMKEARRATNVAGEEVLTEIALVEYVHKVEQQIAANPDVTWRRMGREGLPVKGAEVICP